MKKILFISLVTALLISINAEAKIWRVNNTAGVTADATSLTILFDGINNLPSNPEAANGDTIHVEPSATQYSFPIINKQVVIIGNGYFLGGAGSNPGLQENTETSKIGGFRFASGSAGTRILGIQITANSDFASGYFGVVNLTFEKCLITASPLSMVTANSYTGISFRKCFITASFSVSPASLNDFVMENCIMEVAGGSTAITPTTGSNIVIRNNIFRTLNGFVDFNFSEAYVANNLVLTLRNHTYVNCNIKNNIFSFNQTGVTTGPLSTNGNNLVGQSVASVIVNSGTNDGKFQLAVGSPAIGGGVDISGFKPDCGAFGSSDPYKLSGIPGVPSIYSLTVPASVPLGSPTMNVTFSTRNNN